MAADTAGAVYEANHTSQQDELNRCTDAESVWHPAQGEAEMWAREPGPPRVFFKLT